MFQWGVREFINDKNHKINSNMSESSQSSESIFKIKSIDVKYYLFRSHEYIHIHIILYISMHIFLYLLTFESGEHDFT